MLGIIFSPNRQRFRSQQFELNRTHNNLKIVIRNSSAGCQYMSAVFFIVGEDLVLEWLLKHCAIPYILMSLHKAPKEGKMLKASNQHFFFVKLNVFHSQGPFRVSVLEMFKLYLEF